MKYCKDIFSENREYWLRDIDSDIECSYNYVVDYDTYAKDAEIINNFCCFINGGIKNCFEL